MTKFESITVGGSIIEASKKARNIGAVFDTNLSLKSHCANKPIIICTTLALLEDTLPRRLQKKPFTPLSCQDLTVTILCSMDYHHVNCKIYRIFRMLWQEYDKVTQMLSQNTGIEATALAAYYK